MKLVKLRGESMQAAADAKPSGMVSVIGLDSDKASGGQVGSVLRAKRPVKKRRSMLKMPEATWPWLHDSC